MKKFLSLVLALVMTMSLVTIGAGATEYKNLSDKGEIQYEEAVAVLNKLGIITGYEDGSFKPTGALTRGAAAKIIVSLMIGPEAASALTVSAAPYKDVATTNTFAAVISFCKTSGYINGYADGTFRPTAALSGFAFSKMLLGALGYDGTVENFTGSGWTMNVASLGNKAGLFDDFATAFKGGDGVTREAACLLALNTLKATEVEYTGNTVNVSGKDINVSVGNNKYEAVENKSNTDGNIPGTSVVKDGYMQFAEEHFSDLKLSSSTKYDSFGRPSNQWTYKNVEIGKYSKTADYTYTTTASGDTASDKVKDMGIKDFTLAGGSVTPVINGKDGTAVTKLTQIPDLLGKGTQVLLYVSDSNANEITDIVAIHTQIMQVKKVNSDNVTLKQVETSDDTAKRMNVAVNTVNDDDDAYAVLKGLKADDFVAVVPLATSSAGTSYDVDSAYVPTTVTGNISKVSLDNGAVNGVTVSGTDYKLSKDWTAEDGKDNLKSTSVSSTVQSTVYVDSYGFVLYIADVNASSDYIIYDETYANTVNGRIHYFAQGYDMSGNALSLDMGTNSNVNSALKAGNLVQYTTENAPDNADYKWKTGAAVATVHKTVAAGSYYFDVNGNTTKDAGEAFASDVKFIFLSGSNLGTSTGDVTGVTVKDGVQKITTATDIAYTLDDGEIDTMVIMSDSEVEVSQNIMYVSEVTGQSWNSTDSKYVSVFTGYIDGVETKGLVANKTIDKGFFTYAEKDGVYTMSAYNPSNTSSNYVMKSVTLNKTTGIESKNYITKLGVNSVDKSISDITNTNVTALDARNAQVIDLFTDDGVNYSSIKDMAEAASGTTSFTIAIQFNASANTSNSGKVAYIYIISNDYSGAAAELSTNVVLKNGDIVNALQQASPVINYYVEAANATVSAKRAAVTNALTAASATNIVWNANGSLTFTHGGSEVNTNVVDFNRVYKMTVDGTVKAYVSTGTLDSGAALAKATYGADGYTAAALDLSTGVTGSGFITDETTKDTFAYVAKTNAYVPTTTTHDVTIKTGYVKVDGFNATPTSFSTAIVSGKATLAVAGAPTYAAVNSTLTVTLTVDANAAAAAKSTATLTATGATFDVTTLAAQDVTKEATVAGTTVNWTVKVGTDDVTALTVAIVD